MKCPHCGTENPDNGIFCQKCNGWILAKVYIKPEESAVPAPEPEAAKPVQKTNWKIIVPTVAALCALVLGIALVLPGKKPPEATTLPENLSTSVPPVSSTATQPPEIWPSATEPIISFIANRGTVAAVEHVNKLAFIHDDQLLITAHKIGKDEPEQSLDGNTLAILSDDNRLYYVHESNVSLIAENVTNYRLSADGSAVAYALESGLWLYRPESGSNFISGAKVKDYILSPDGYSIAFLVLSDRNINEVADIYLWNRGWSNCISSGANWRIYDKNRFNLLAVPNGGQRVYTYTPELRLAVLEGDDPIFLSGFVPLAEDFALNANYVSNRPTTPALFLSADHRQILFYTEDGTQLLHDGCVITQISDQILGPVLPSRTSILRIGSILTLPYYDLEEMLYQQRITYVDTAVSDNDDATVMQNDSVYAVLRLGHGGNTEILAQNCQQFWLNQYATELFYQDESGSILLVTLGEAWSTQTVYTEQEPVDVDPDHAAVIWRDLDQVNMIIDGNRTHSLWPMIVGRTGPLQFTPDQSIYLIDRSRLYYSFHYYQDFAELLVMDSGQVYLHQWYDHWMTLRNNRLIDLEEIELDI